MESQGGQLAVALSLSQARGSHSGPEGDVLIRCPLCPPWEDTLGNGGNGTRATTLIWGIPVLGVGHCPPSGEKSGCEIPRQLG